MDRATVWLRAVERLAPSSIAQVVGGDPSLTEGYAAELMDGLCRQALSAGGCRVLIAEDERITALELREALEEMGHAVLAVAPTAGQAISAASLHEPDLALVDIRLKGGTDGVSAAREIQDALGTPVILMTAFTDQATRADSIRPYGFLPKPWSEEDLRRVLDEALVRIALERRS
jgi:CheY-like chemotaxis protein